MGEAVNYGVLDGVESVGGLDFRFVHNFGLRTWNKRSLGRPRRRWENNIKIYLKIIGSGCGLNSSSEIYLWQYLTTRNVTF